MSKDILFHILSLKIEEFSEKAIITIIISKYYKVEKTGQNGYTWDKVCSKSKFWLYKQKTKKNNLHINQYTTIKGTLNLTFGQLWSNCLFLKLCRFGVQNMN